MCGSMSVVDMFITGVLMVIITGALIGALVTGYQLIKNS